MTRPVLTYDTATPEQVTAARVEARAKLAAARERCTPEYWARLQAKFGITPAQG